MIVTVEQRDPVYTLTLTQFEAEVLINLLYEVSGYAKESDINETAIEMRESISGVLEADMTKEWFNFH